jgi:hypothetical protein
MEFSLTYLAIASPRASLMLVDSVVRVKHCRVNRTLRGINETAPYFHDHRASTLENVVEHYHAFFFFINVVRGLPLPQIPDEDIAPIVAYMKKAF